MAPMKRPATKPYLEDREDTLSLDALARRWHITHNEARQLLAEGELPFVQIAGKIRVPCEAIAEQEESWPSPIES
ncbi:MerR family transcriptional regulator [Adhaeretor mobilis]|uniref:Helix-turn-helix domain-containing protein n=1 Tax=Adhaeretor mobilis TaxID=1930276 RepID=A0A517MYB6_9BACT|nr:helix-turn-helix domain-containing protein [Adhaeretor mobilis]QDS99874.1 hypothetical protein HG15A2_32050 [Adhaeretor mobilis]